MVGLLSTPVPSPSTSVSLGLGSPAADDGGSLKSPAVEAPRRSLRLAGAASPGTPPAASSDRDGASSGARGRRKGRPRASAVAAAASPEVGELGSDGGGGGEARASGGTGGGSSGQGARMSLRSGSRLGKRPVEPDAHAEMGLGPDGGGSGSGHNVHDEMLQQDADGMAKRRKGVSAQLADYVADSESDSDDDFVLPVKGSASTLAGAAADYVPDSESDREDFVLPGDRGLKVPANLFTPFNLTEPIVVATGSHMTGQGSGGSVRARRGGIGQVNDRNEQLFSEESMLMHDSAEKAAGGIVKPLASAADKAFADVDFSEVLRHESRNRGEGNSKLVLGNNDSGSAVSVGIPSGTRTRKFSRDDKGKGKMVAEEVLLPQKLSDDDMDWEPVVLQENQSVSGAADADVEPLWRQAARERAIKLAPKFAFFKADEDVHSDEDDEEELEPAADAQDWPGPYSTALRIMDDRDAKLRARELNPSSKLANDADNVILWTPLKNKKAPLRPVPSLASLCMQTLASHAEGIESLGGIPEELKHKLLTELCRSRKMNTHLLTEILCDNPVALQLRECSWLNEDDFEAVFGKCMTESLEVLQLDLSGRCIPDYILPATLAKVPNCMPLLRKISLMGNYRLSDNGLDKLISAAPSLSSLNLSECSLLTSTGIENLANRLQSVLRELYINDCLNVDAMMVLPALKKIKHLEVLSMSGIQSVCDKFVNELIPIHGSNIRELAFAGCLKLTSSSIKTIGVNCPQLSSLDIRNLNRLRDSATRHLRDGCRLIKKLKLQKNTFSDVALSQFLEESGGSLTELSLNNIEKVGNLTARAIALKCSVRLEVLDVSFCRGLSNEALGLIVDSCSSLKTLKLFGCTQITDIFLKGHSNSLVKIIGIEGSILEQLGRC
ncbi:hypothetical protein CFC21_104848 [Triticum aestivum]|uniref:Uncharacterized protein n=3 Tax=Triticum aestivum TaxID=4565 RepID=A0A9R1N7X2_WHEAT|nr:hypothetical protein CFC21_104847 [Triticum aestivum]KAF7103917.1 hypothetical protein CFC21_104848 [Triticum aestivum]